MANFIVLAGGPSVRSFDLYRLHTRGVLLAVNDAALYTQPHYALSKCATWVRNRGPFLGTLGIPEVWLDEGTRKQWELVAEPLAHRQTIRWFEEDTDNSAASFKGRHLSGDNSGHAAANLALQMAKNGDRIYLLGFDMGHDRHGREYWYPSYPWMRPLKQTTEEKFFAWRCQLGWLHDEARVRGVSVSTVECGRNLPDLPSLSFNDFRDLATLS